VLAPVSQELAREIGNPVAETWAGPEDDSSLVVES
jgi:hypothetical protein